MKKIIELAERYINAKLSTESPQEVQRIKIWNTFKELRSAMTERRKLENTPITEDWLKEHGWERNEMVFNAWSKTSEVGIREFATLILVNCYNKGWYVCDTPIRVNTAAQLLDACDLCGIKID